MIKICQNSTTATFITGRFVIRIRSAATFAAVASEHGVDHSGGTADTGLNGNGVGRAIQTASAAFHAGIAILYGHVFAIHLEHFMGTNIKAHSTAGAFIFIQLQSDHIFQINRIFHFLNS
jgi:hypothetical protein